MTKKIWVFPFFYLFFTYRNEKFHPFASWSKRKIFSTTPNRDIIFSMIVLNLLLLTIWKDQHETGKKCKEEKNRFRC